MKLTWGQIREKSHLKVGKSVGKSVIVEFQDRKSEHQELAWVRFSRGGEDCKTDLMQMEEFHLFLEFSGREKYYPFNGWILK